MKYFTDLELQSPDTLEYRLAPGFGERLDILREAYGSPIIINSGARSYNYNKLIGGHPKSLHVYDTPYHPTGGCCAVDIHMKDSVSRGKLLKDAYDLGFSLGIDTNFIHIDDRTRVLNFKQVVYVY